MQNHFGDTSQPAFNDQLKFTAQLIPYIYSDDMLQEACKRP